MSGFENMVLWFATFSPITISVGMALIVAGIVKRKRQRPWANTFCLLGIVIMIMAAAGAWYIGQVYTPPA
ncbi:hypothetical protein C7446_1190 [Kushneria sinocarnis]|uniref:Uncharacterized protein n=1 Tax=Kushneria sinocarnis TaxID=595502 RepID=A0A420WYF2_9GAMM|nr:hypothetical protein [Kushneria sinocarnis]RKR06252.1 hypothetical protein C7446_1190 [Kushneria sinocarnis]